MAYWFKIIVVLCAFVAPARAGADSVSSLAGAITEVGGGSSVAGNDSCECPKLSCDFECEYEQSMTFYSEKCAGGTRVRSCARPTCLPLPNAPKNCGAAKNEMKDAGRSVASESKPSVEADKPSEAKVVGEVTGIEGKAWLVASDLERAPLAKGSKLRETDRVATGDKSKLEIHFLDGNSVTLTANSVLELSKLNFNDDMDKRNTLLNLIKGRVRSKVRQKYADTPQSHFRVKTKAAVAGVRGTDFVMSLEQINSDLVAKVETVSGEVELASPLRQHRALIAKAQTASYIATGLANLGPASEEIEADFASRGRMTPVTKLSEEKLRVIEQETRVNYVAARKPTTAANRTRICTEPEGEFNQCSWTCVNNPSGEKRCRTDLPHVNCIRRVCDANGNWSDAARLPAAFADQCDPNKVIVGPCDY